VDRYNLALFLLTLAVAPLFYLSGWLSVVAAVAIYCLVARLANRDLDRQSGRRCRLHAGVLRRLDSANPEVRGSRTKTLR
jgi:hypothetical protein